jgi:hypothetical protein
MRFTPKNPIPISWSIEGTSQQVPSLTMLVNPTNLEKQYTSLINETRTLGGFVQEYWGEQLTVLNASGRTAMFVDEQGLSNANARNSESYQYFVSLLNIYKNNGKDYYSTYTTVASQRNPTRITNFGFINMFFDHKQYQGRFDSFDYSEVADKPFNLDYNFSFKVFNVIGEARFYEGNYGTL